MLDVIFLSYNEPNAEQNLERLKKFAPWVQHVSGVKGIPQAHIEAAKIAKTRHFYVVDGDAYILNFDFHYEPTKHESNKVHVWRSKNAVNGLIYGYGGVKIFPRQTLLDANIEGIIDFCTSVTGEIKIMQDTISESRFNSSAFDAWKGGFRECAKLAGKSVASNVDSSAEKRLETWTTIGEEAPYGKYCIAGAKMGREYGHKHKGNSSKLEKVNDFNWLKKQFNDYQQK